MVGKEGNIMDGHSIKIYKVFSIWTRIFHWMMVISIATLFATGLYIGDPFYVGTQGVEPTLAVKKWASMSNIRLIHFAAAYLLIAAFIFRIYGFIVHKGDRLLPKPWTKLFWTGMIDVGLHYGFMRPAHRPYLRNSMARGGYATVYAMIAIEAITGFAMYAQVAPNTFFAKLVGIVNFLLVDEYIVHLVHHYVAWMIMLFVIVHVYMATRADMSEKNGEISSMFSGVKFCEEEPDDIGDLK